MSGFWQYGERAAIAKIVGMPLSNLYQILHRCRGVSVKRARKLEAASKQVLPKPISLIDWVTNASTAHPAFTPIKNG